MQEPTKAVCNICQSEFTIDEIQAHTENLHPQKEEVQSDNIENPQAIPQTPLEALVEEGFNKAEEVLRDARPSVETNEPQAIQNPTDTVQAAEGEVVENKMGRPSKYNEGMLIKAKDYLATCMEGEVAIDKKGNKVRRHKMPLLEELARICDVHGETLENWSEEHEDFFETIKKIKELQKERIIQRGFSMGNPTFAIFMLKANHGMIETEKRILAGEKNSEPMQVSITDYKGANQPQITDAVKEAIVQEGTE